MFYIFGSEIKVHRSIEVSGYTEIIMRYNRPVAGIKTYLNYKLWTLNFEQTILNIFGPAMKVHRSIEVSECIEINRNAMRDVQSTSKKDENHLRHKKWTLSRQF